MRAVVTPARMASGGLLPGLVDVWADDGREWRDLTLRQLDVVRDRERLELELEDGRRIAGFGPGGIPVVLDPMTPVGAIELHDDRGVQRREWLR
jgi:hypothetical protein